VVNKPSIFQRASRLFRLAEPEVLDRDSEPGPTIDMGPQLNRNPLGSSGTEIYSGYIQEEALYNLRGSRAAELWDRVRRGDGAVNMCLSAVKNPLRSSSWEFEPVDQSDEEKKIAEFANDLLFFGMEKSWSQVQNELLTIPVYGYTLFEEVHKPVLDHKKWGPHVRLQSLGWRSPKTIEKFNVDPVTERLLSVTQQAHGDLGRQVDMPAEFLLHIAPEQEGANFEGVSMLRPAYGAWFRKNAYLKLNAIGIEKYAVPTPMLEFPSDKSKSPEYAQAVEALRRYTSHQSNYITMPTGWKIDLKSGQYDPEKVRTAIEGENQEIIYAFCANFLLLGTGGNGGAFALGKDLSDFFLSSLEYLAKIIGEKLSMGPMKRLIDAKFGPRERYPMLKASGVSDKAGAEFGTLIKALVDAKTIVPDDDLEIHVRKRMGLPPPSEEGKRETQPTPPMLPGQTPPGSEPPKDEPAKKNEGSEDDDAEQDEGMQFSESSRKLAERGPQKFIRAAREEAAALMRESLSGIAEDYAKRLMKEWDRLSPASRASAIQAAQIQGRSTYRQAIVDALAMVAERALSQARAEIPSKRTVKLAESRRSSDALRKLPKHIQRRIHAQADLLSETQLEDLRKKIAFQYGNSLSSTDSRAILEADLVQAGLAFVDGGTVVTAAGNVISLVVNETRNAFFFDPEVSDEIAAFQFINGDPQSPICRDLAGKVFDAKDPEARRYMPPLHHNCESYIVPILKGSPRAGFERERLRPSSPELEKHITLAETDRCSCDE
jgi:hypothetical protein